MGLGELVCIAGAALVAIVGPLIAIVVVMRLRGRGEGDADER